MSLRIRFTIFFTLLSSLLLILFSTTVFLEVRKESLTRVKIDLEALIEHEWEHIDLPAHQAKEKKGVPHFRDTYIRVWKNNILIFDSFPLGIESPEVDGSVRRPSQIFYTLSRSHNGHQYRICGYFDLAATLKQLNFIRNVLFFGCLLAFLLIIPISLIFTRFLLKPFRTLAHQTTQLTAANLHFRFNQPRKDDEYGMLARNFNALLDKLQNSFQQISHFAVKASHELRTPLSVIISQGEMVTRKPPEKASDWLPVVHKMLSQAKNLRNLINRLFVLSEIERMDDKKDLKPLNAKETIEEIIHIISEARKPLLKEISFQWKTPESIFKTNQEIFQSILINLVENAFKYSSHKVRVEGAINKESLILHIEDDGPGIEGVLRENVFEPFFTIPQKDGPTEKGYGLGLSIVKACIVAIKGSIELGKSSMGGLAIKVVLPVQ